MKIERIVEAFFSPTGGTERVTRMLGEGWTQEKKVIDLSDCHMAYGDIFAADNELWIIGVPSFGGRAPGAVVERLRLMKGCRTPVFLVVTYGNRAYEDTMIELKTVLEENGFVVTAAAAVVTEHSIVREIAAGRPDEQDQNQLAEYAVSIQQLLENAQSPRSIAVPGNVPYKEYHVIPTIPKAGKECDGCGICALKCPVGAIKTDSPAQVDKEKCICCMRCVKVCPKQTRRVNGVLLKAAGMKLKKVCKGRKENQLFTGENEKVDVT